jgi:hypothetical protein
MSELNWYACVYEGEARIIYGRAPVGSPDEIVEDIKRSLLFHDLIGLRSRVFLRSSRLHPDAVLGFCEEKADKNSGDYQDFKVVKLDLRGAPEDSSPPSTD